MSDYTGVKKRRGGWRADIRHECERYALGTWPTPEGAAKAYDAAALYFRGEGSARNFPEEAEPKSPRQLHREAHYARARARGDSSVYIGVDKVERHGNELWHAQISLNDKTRTLGEYQYEEDAARAFDAATRYYRSDGLTNFDGEEALSIAEIRRRCKRFKHQKPWPGKRKHTSKYRGVSWSEENGKWRAQITWTKEDDDEPYRKHLGYYESEEDAAQAYDEAARELHGEKARMNFDPEE